MLSLTNPGGLEGEFRAVVGGKDFACQMLDQYPDRLYCIGPELEHGSEVLFQVYETGFPGSVFVAAFVVPLLKPGPTGVTGSKPATTLIQFGGGHGASYSPAQATIKVGDTVEWQGDFSIHPLVSDDGLWATVSTGSVFGFTFTMPGTYHFHCQVHEALGMAGQVIVAGS